MTYKVVFRRASQREFGDAALWYEERRIGLGSEFRAEIERAIESVAQNPARFPIMHRDIRCIRARRFPYSVFFRVEATRVVVLAVFHVRRDPLIWRGRA
jgi:plasmid stabilization system protein ParE